MDTQAKVKRIGRPPYRDPAERTRTLGVCVSTKDRLVIEARAAEVGMSVSAYVRASALAVPARSKREVQLIADLGAVGEAVAAVIEALKGLPDPDGKIAGHVPRLTAAADNLATVARRL